MVTATLTSKGQITVPKAVRESLRLHTGDRVAFVVRDQLEAVMKPAQPRNPGKDHKMSQTRLTHILLAAVFLAGCGKKASDEIDFGVVKNSVYQNKYFGLTVAIPPEWSIQDQEAQQQLTDRGRKMLAGDDKNLKAVMKASEMQTVNLLAAFKHPIGAPVAFNPSIACVAERVRQMPGIKRGKDYLFHTKELLASSQMNVTFPSDISTASLGGKDFDVMDTEISIVGKTIRQRYYVAIMKGYALAIVVSFIDTEDESSLKAILESVKIK